MEFEKGKNELDFTKPAEADSLKIRSFAIIDKDHIRHISAKPFLKIIKRSLQHWAVEYHVRLIVMARYALNGGINILWSVFATDIEKIIDCKQRIHKAGNTEFEGMFENGCFDIGASEFTGFNGRFDKDDIMKCHGLASAVGISNSVVYQLAIVTGLFEAFAEKLTGNENAFYKNLLERFKNWLQKRSFHAFQIVELAEKNSQPQIEGPLYTLNDVFNQSDEKEYSNIRRIP